jgi:hypothetical protein
MPVFQPAAVTTVDTHHSLTSAIRTHWTTYTRAQEGTRRRASATTQPLLFSNRTLNPHTFNRHTPQAHITCNNTTGPPRAQEWASTWRARSNDAAPALFSNAYQPHTLTTCTHSPFRTLDH